MIASRGLTAYHKKRRLQAEMSSVQRSAAAFARFDRAASFVFEIRRLLLRTVADLVNHGLNQQSTPTATKLKH